MEKASHRGKRGRSIADIRQFQEYLQREGLSLAQWEKRQTGDAVTQALRQKMQKLQQKYSR